LLEAVVLFYRVLIEARVLFPFEMCGLVIGDEWLSFYIKPSDGYELPKIMQWLKQTFSCRFNVKTGRTGHVWGDRYWSEILVGDPPLGAEKVAGGDASIQRGGSMPPHRGTVFKQRPHRFGRGCWVGLRRWLRRKSRQRRPTNWPGAAPAGRAGR
jgi:hypothetical protein